MSTSRIRIFATIVLLTILMGSCKKDKVEPVDDLEGDWTQLTTSGTVEERHECSFTLVNDKGYLIGGRGMHPVEELDLNTNTWRQLEAPPFEINHFQALSFNGEVWMVGGFTGGFPHETPVANMLIFTPSSNQWTIGNEIPANRRRGAAGAFVRDGKIYLVGGITDGHWAGTVPWFDEYDPATDQWTTLEDAPHARDHFNAVLINDKLYLAGGRRTSESTGELFDLTVPELDVYDFSKKSWSSFASEKRIPTQRAGCSAVNLGGQLVIIGGESSSQEQAHNNCEAYDPSAGTWKALQGLKTGRHGTQAFVYKGNIYTAAGSANRGGGPELNSTEKFSTQ